MTKRLYFALIILMSISLSGIITMQVYWISESIEVKQQQFSQLITQSLKSVSNDLQSIDIRNFADRYKKAIKGINISNDRSSDLIRGIDNKGSIIDKNKNGLASQINTVDLDIILTEFRRTNNVIIKIENKKNNTNDNRGVDLQNYFNDKDSLNFAQISLIYDKYKKLGNAISIRKRVSKELLERLISRHLSENNISTRFEYAILNNGLITPIYSNRYSISKEEFSIPIFSDEYGLSSYSLNLELPNKKDYVLSSMWVMLALSILFTLIIIITYASALYLIFKHKKTSDVKTDFINNMTHELKTPIATISLSIDAIVNPKIISNKEKVFHYARVIKEENKRMNDQIENVLRISRLEKNELDLNKQEVSLNELVEEAINHLLIIVEDRQGSIEFDLDADPDTCFIDPLHFENVLVNMLDNANKYSVEAPRINISTYNELNNVVIEISDKGLGIDKDMQDKVFDKFFRVTTGNIHNIKGQGLGLAYVKKIIDGHNGTITVNSTKGSGSTFTIKVPQIKINKISL